MRARAFHAVFAFVLSAFCASTARAQAHELLSEASSATRASVICGRVLSPGGVPAPGAVVTSSAGGTATSDDAGSFELEVELPLEAAEVHLTAVHSGSGSTLVAGARIALASSSTMIRTSDLELGAGTCVPSWLPTFGQYPGMNLVVQAVAAFDDGSGTALHAAGSFTTAGGISVNRIAKWDGSEWSPLDLGLNDEVLALVVWDDGNGGGPALYAAGKFLAAGGTSANRIAKWDGATWSPLGLGLNLDVHSLGVADDGSGGGSALYAGGIFTDAGGAPANCIAKWDGSSWSPLGNGIDGSFSLVHALVEFDDGSGPSLFVAGRFTSASGVIVNGIAKWDGTAWFALGSGLGGPLDNALAVAVFDDGSGSGPALFVGGSFDAAGGLPAAAIAKWDGSSWSTLGSGLGGVSFPRAYALAVHDDGNGGGPALYVGGDFTTAGGASANRMAKWDGSSWSALDSGCSASVYCLASVDDGGGAGGGASLYAGGPFGTAGGEQAKRIAKWDGSSWRPLGGGINEDVRALAVFDDGAGGGPALYVGGDFTDTAGVPASHVAKWDGSSWSPVGSGMSDTVHALVVFDDGLGGGPALYAGGEFQLADGLPANYVAKWDGASWSPLGVGTNKTVFALEVFEVGGAEALYAGGDFTRAGGMPASRIAKWNGSSWSALGSGLNHWVRDLVVHDDGSGAGPALYAGGLFTTAGGLSANYVARWNGSSWSALGGGLNDEVFSVTSHDDGSPGGPALFAGGEFTIAGGVSASRVAKWNGASWSALGSGISGSTVTQVVALTSYDDGTGNGAELYAGGRFVVAGGLAANHVAKWNGSSWSTLDSGVSWMVHALLAREDEGGAGSTLVVGGAFYVSPGGDSFLAQWGGCATGLGTPYCFGDGSATACPCGNAGGPDQGCANSTGNGATLAASGTASVSADDLGFTAHHLRPNQVAMLFCGANAVNQGNGIVFGDGLRCAGGGERRLGLEVLDASGSATWGPGLGAIGEWSQGDTRRFQVWYRDPNVGPCGSNFNLSHGVEISFVH